MAHIPTELLLHIVDFLRGDSEYQKTLSSLCKVSRYFLQTFQATLFEAPESHWLTYRDLWIFTRRLLCALSRRTGPLQHPSLISMIRRISLHIPTNGRASRPADMTLAFEKYASEDPERWAEIRDWGLAQWGAMLLGGMSKLEVLEISSDVWEHDHVDPPYPNLLKLMWDMTRAGSKNSKVFTSIHTLKLCNVLPTAPFLALPKLRTLELDGKFCMPNLSRFPNLEVENLTIHFMLEMFWCMSVTPSYKLGDRFIELIEKCTKLKSLKLYFLENSQINGMLNAPLDPGWDHLCHKIAAAAPTLETLDLTNPPHATPISRLWLYVLHPVDSLARFTKLKSLTIFDVALCICGIEGVPSYVAALPRSLEKLNVQWTHSKVANKDWQQTGHFQFAMERIEHLVPNLKTVSIYNGPGAEYDGEYKIRNLWDSDSGDEEDESDEVLTGASEMIL